MGPEEVGIGREVGNGCSEVQRFLQDNEKVPNSVVVIDSCTVV